MFRNDEHSCNAYANRSNQPHRADWLIKNFVASSNAGFLDMRSRKNNQFKLFNYAKHLMGHNESVIFIFISFFFISFKKILDAFCRTTCEIGIHTRIWLYVFSIKWLKFVSQLSGVQMKKNGWMPLVWLKYLLKWIKCQHLLLCCRWHNDQKKTKQTINFFQEIVEESGETHTHSHTRREAKQREIAPPSLVLHF